MKDTLIFEQLVENLMNQGHAVKFRALGTSMAPTINSGDSITIIPCDISEINIGEIVFYKHSSQAYTAHRIIEKFENQRSQLAITKGDNEKDPDEAVLPTQILGKVINIEKRSGSNWDSQNIISLSIDAVSSKQRHIEKMMAFLRNSLTSVMTLLG